MRALLLGSIGTLSDTSELQRRAFNEAFRSHDLDWTWERDAYRHMLRQAGGRDRIAAQAEAQGEDVDAGAVHATKSRLFQSYLDAGEASARPGLADLMARAGGEGVALGLVTTTERANVERLLEALGIERATFHVIVSREDVAAAKPAPDCYHYAAAMLAVAPEHCVAVEDNADGVRAAQAAGMTCVAWPNANTQGHDFDGATVAGADITQAVWSGADRVAAE